MVVLSVLRKCDLPAMPLCSVIIPTYNRHLKLWDCLNSLVRQTVTDFEIVIIDDASSKKTGEEVKKFIAQHPSLHITYIRLPKNRGCATARNEGIKRAQGNILLFTDDDCVVPANWIETHTATHERYSEAVGVGGWYWPTEEILATDRYNRFYERAFEKGYPGMRDAEVYSNVMRSPAGNTANTSYKRWIFDQGFCFDEYINFSGNVDWDLKQQLHYSGYGLVYIPFPVVHTKQLTFLMFMRVGIRRGRGMDYRARKYAQNYVIGGESVLTIREILLRTMQWHGSVGEYSWVAFFYYVAMLFGKYINRLTFFSPKIHIPVTSTIQFTHWVHNGVVYRKEEWRPFVFLSSYLPMIGKHHVSDIAAMRATVVVPVFNRGPLLSRIIDALLNQTLSCKSYEVIIVDDGSTDTTSEVVHLLQQKYPHHALRYIYQDNAGPAAARNRGVSEAHGTIVLFSDSDCIVPDDWISTHLYAHEQYPEIGAAGGGQRVRDDQASRYDRYRNSYFGNAFSVLYPNKVLITNNVLSQIVPYDTGNLSVKKQFFQLLGGFDESFRKPAYEDLEFSFRMQHSGYTMALIPLVVENIGVLDRGSFKRRVELQREWQPLFLKKTITGPMQPQRASAPEIVCVRAFFTWFLKPTNEHWCTYLVAFYHYFYKAERPQK